MNSLQVFEASKEEILRNEWASLFIVSYKIAMSRNLTSIDDIINEAQYQLQKRGYDELYPFLEYEHVECQDFLMVARAYFTNGIEYNQCQNILIPPFVKTIIMLGEAK